MDGFGSHTFSMLNAKGERFFVKYRFTTKQGIRNLSPAKALELAWTDPDHAQRDLFEAIECGDFEVDDGDSSHERGGGEGRKANPIRHHEGLTAQGPSAHRGPSARLEQESRELFRGRRASGVRAVVGGPWARLLAGSHAAGRLFAYADAQRHRLGVNYHQIPVNKPSNPTLHYHRDGAFARMAMAVVDTTTARTALMPWQRSRIASCRRTRPRAPSNATIIARTTTTTTRGRARSTG
jgi:catalase